MDAVDVVEEHPDLDAVAGIGGEFFAVQHQLGAVMSVPRGVAVGVGLDAGSLGLIKDDDVGGAVDALKVEDRRRCISEPDRSARRKRTSSRRS